MRCAETRENSSLLSRSLLIWPQSGCSHKPRRWIGRGSEGFDRSPPAQIIREVYGGDAMEPPHVDRLPTLTPYAAPTSTCSQTAFSPLIRVNVGYWG